MRIQTKLVTSFVVLLAGMTFMAASSLLALKGIENNVRDLADTASLHTDVLSMHDKVQAMSADFFELGKAESVGQMERISARIAADIKAASAVHYSLKQRGVNDVPDYHIEFEREFSLMRQAVEQRLVNIAYYKTQANEIRRVLGQIEKAVSSTTDNIRQVDRQAQSSAETVHQESQRLNENARYLSELRKGMKDMQIAMAELDGVKNRFRLAPLRERLSAAVAHLGDMEERSGGAALDAIRRQLIEASRLLLEPGTGLIALRGDVLLNRAAEAAYLDRQKQVADALSAVNRRLAEELDPIELQLAEGRSRLVVANRNMRTAARVEVAGHDINLAVKSISIDVGLAMSSTSAEEIAGLAANMERSAANVWRNVATLKTLLREIGQNGLLGQVNEIALHLGAVQEAVSRLTDARRSVLASQGALDRIVEQMQAFERKQAGYSAQQVAVIGRQQQGVMAKVQRSVGNSFTVILAFALLLFLAWAACSALISRSISVPLARLSEAIANIRKGTDLSVRVRQHGRDELGLLIQGFNGMLEHMEQRDIALKQAKADADAASRAKSEFLAKMSHEIRTPMNGVLGMTELLQRSELSQKQQRFVQTVHRSGESLLSIIDDILDFSKIESGKLLLERTVFDLHQIIDDVVALFADGIQRKSIEFTCRVDGNVPQHVRGDPVRLRQILTNLLNNATKFTERGEISVAFSAPGPGEVCLTVSDTGIGMSPEAAASVFQPFRQADSSTTRKYGGTGLGLSIVKQLAEMMGGSVLLKSEEGRGSTFAVTLGLETVAPPEAAPAATEAVSLSGLNVLIVDDNQTNRDILLQHAMDWQMAASIAADGAEALALLQAAQGNGRAFDLAIIDMRMPVMDGIELVRIIKADAALAALRVIMLSSLDASSDVRLVLSLGVEYCLTKPVRAVELRHCIEAATGVLPAAPPSLAGAAPVAAQPAAASAEAGRVEAHMLLVEDNAINQEIALAMLEETGYRVTLADNGRRALAACLDQEFDIILMDCQMPEMDGFEATSRLRLMEAERGRGRTPVIALTANAILGDRERCLDAGMDDYIAKPYTRSVLLAALARWTRAPEPSAPALAGEAAVANVPEPAPAVSDAGERPALLDPAALQALRAMRRPGRPDVLGRIIDLFHSDAPRLLGEMQVAAAACDAEAMRLAAHTLKSSCANVGAVSMSSTCREIEHYARGNDVDSALAHIQSVKEELAHVLAALAIEKETT